MKDLRVESLIFDEERWELRFTLLQTIYMFSTILHIQQKQPIIIKKKKKKLKTMFINIKLKKIKIMDVYLKDLRVKSLIFDEERWELRIEIHTFVEKKKL